MQAHQHSYDQSSAVSQMAMAHAIGKRENRNQKGVFQLMDNRPQSIIQLKTVIENTPQTYNYGTGTAEVGKTMEAWLDPKKPQKGWSANLNKAQDKMMTAIRTSYGIDGGDLVKGHLLNDNLGGTALNKNLYPITRGANKAHLSYVENKVKELSWQEKVGVYYRVDVLGRPNIHESKATFVNEVRLWDPSKIKDKSGKKVLHRIVNSNLEDLRNTKDVQNVEGSDDPITISGTARPKGHTPFKTVGALSEEHKSWRGDDADDLGFAPFPEVEGHNKKTSLINLNPKEHAERYKDNVSSMTDREAAGHYSGVGGLGGLGYGAYAAATAAAGTTGATLAMTALAATGIGALAGLAGYGIYRWYSGPSKSKKE